MHEALKARERERRPIRIGLVGAGTMGLGIVWQIGRAPDMELSFVTDLDTAAARKAESVYGKPTRVAMDAISLLRDDSIPCDVLV